MIDGLSVATHEIDGREGSAAFANRPGIQLREREVQPRDLRDVRRCVGNCKDVSPHLTGSPHCGVRYDIDTPVLDVDDGDIDAVQRGTAHNSGDSHCLLNSCCNSARSFRASIGTQLIHIDAANAIRNLVVHGLEELYLNGPGWSRRQLFGHLMLGSLMKSQDLLSAIDDGQRQGCKLRNLDPVASVRGSRLHFSEEKNLIAASLTDTWRVTYALELLMSSSVSSWVMVANNVLARIFCVNVLDVRPRPAPARHKWMCPVQSHPARSDFSELPC